MANASDYEARLFHAAADGVGPSVLLSAPRGAAQYLISVPEGLSRLTLEHKTRPTARLACVLLTSLQPDCAGGLGGLLLRLAQDGHGQLQLIGPVGSAAFTHSLRHIFHWRHPKVFVSECHLGRPVPVFNDEHAVIVPLSSSENSGPCPLCSPVTVVKPFHSQKAAKFAPTTTEAVAKELCSISHRDSSKCLGSGFDCRSLDAKISCTKAPTAAWQEEQVSEAGTGCFGDKVKESSKDSSSSSDEELSRRSSKRLRHSNWGGIKRNGSSTLSSHCEEFGLFSELDALFTEGLIQRSKRKQVIVEQSKGITPSKPHVEGKDGVVKYEVISTLDKYKFKEGRHKSQSIADVRLIGGLRLNLKKEFSNDVSKLENPDKASAGVLNIGKVNAVEFLSTAMQQSLSTKLHKGADGSAKLQCEGNNRRVACDPDCNTSLSCSCRALRYGWLVENTLDAVLPDLADSSNPVYIKHPQENSNTLGIPESQRSPVAFEDTNFVRDRENRANSAGGNVLGFFCYLKALRSGVVIVDVKTLDSLDGFQLDARLIFASLGVDLGADVGNKGGCLQIVRAVIHFTPLSVLRTERYTMWMKSFGCDVSHIIMHKEPANFGFNSSLSILAKLNLINAKLFPLPFGVQFTADPAKDAGITEYDFDVQVWASRPLMRVVFQKMETGEVKVKVDSSACLNKINIEALQEKVLLNLPREIGLLAGMGGASLLAAPSTFEASAITIGQENPPSSVPGIDCNSVEYGCPGKEIAGSFEDTGNISLSESSSLQQSCIDNKRDTSSKDSIEQCTGKDHEAENETEGLGFEITFLGTGSAEPSKYRGSSGILLQVRGCRGAMLLDAGEGVYGQLMRKFGKDGVMSVINSLQCVWLSHKHADHVLGLMSIIYARTVLAPPLLVVGSSAVRDWLAELEDIYRISGYSCPFSFVHCKDFNWSKHKTIEGADVYKNYQRALDLVLDGLQLKSVGSVIVDHCYESFGLVLFAKSGWSIVYSGDTRPCKRLSQAGFGCTLLIHEATFEDDSESHAKGKRHSTVGEALQMGQQMGASHIILTHFSKRCPKVVKMDTSKYNNVFLAFDGMEVRGPFLRHLPSLMPLLTAILMEENAIVKDESCMTRELPCSSSCMVDGSQNLGRVEPREHSKIGHEECISFIQNSQMRVPFQVAKVGSGPKHIRWLNSDSEEE